VGGLHRSANGKRDEQQSPRPATRRRLTTILEKSLGAVAKGGTTNLVDVYEYAAAVTAKGFVYMDTPGYDPVRRPARSPAAPT
jgi:altronate hydrolase